MASREVSDLFGGYDVRLQNMPGTVMADFEGKHIRFRKQRSNKMPYLIETIWYPSDKVMEVAEKYFEVIKKFPPDGSLGNEVVPGAVTAGQQGIEVMTILDVKEGELEAALERSRKAMAMYIGIAGLEYSIQLRSTIEEALASVGMSLPK